MSDQTQSDTPQDQNPKSDQAAPAEPVAPTPESKKPETPAEQTAQAEPTNEATKETSAPTPTGPKILLVEDEKPMARALSLKLQNSNYQVTMVHDGQAALDAVKADKFDLILMDLVMPKMDGFTLLQNLKDLGVKTPTVVLSNLSQDEDFQKAKELGATDFFIKSDIPVSSVVEKVKGLVGK